MPFTYENQVVILSEMEELELRKYIDVLHSDNALFEVRILEGSGRASKTYSGYFTDSGKAFEEIKRYPNRNTYLVFNEINEACYSREQRDTIIQSNITTSDADITSRKWILIDIDPSRPSGTNASNEELELAFRTMQKVGSFLRSNGFADPVLGMSGNGYHLMYRIHAKNSPEVTEVVKKFLNYVALIFNTDKVSIDTSVFNPSRITKLLGTRTAKGTSKDKTRPQRASKLIHVPKDIQKNDMLLVKKVADMMPEPEKPTYQNNYGRDSFDIDGFIAKNGIKVESDVRRNGVRKIVLEECVFNSNHKAPDSAIFVLDSGAIGYKCFHNSCTGHAWRDVRQMFEPDAYDRGNVRSSSPVYAKKNIIPSVKPEQKGLGAKFLQMHEIERLDRSMIVSLKTGFHYFDKELLGLIKGELSIVSGTSGSGKSTWINQIALNVVNSGFNASIWSGELKDTRMKNWIHQQAAGKQYVTSANGGEYYYVKENYGSMIDNWLKGKLFIYNNQYGNDVTQIFSDIREHVNKHKLDLLILDNLMALNIAMFGGDKLERQTVFINQLVSLAKELDAHIILVAHPRKTTGFIRKWDIAGNADITNLADNVFIVHRVNNDFMRTSGEFYGEREASKFFGFDNVVECSKNRDAGVQDRLFGFYFEKESKRFLNDRFETANYGWTDSINPVQVSMHDYHNVDFETGEILEEKKEEDYPF